MQDTDFGDLASDFLSEALSLHHLAAPSIVVRPQGRAVHRIDQSLKAQASLRRLIVRT